MKPHLRISSAVVSLSLSLLTSGTAEATNLTFTTIAETGGPFSSYSSLGAGLGTAGGWSGYNLTADANYQRGKGLSIHSSKGQVTYFATLKSGEQGIFTSTGKAPKLIANNSGTSLFSGFGQGLSMKKDGTVAFFANLKSGGQGVFTSNGIGNISTTIASTQDSYSSFAPGLSLNDKGTVAFLANLDTGGQEIFSSDGSTTGT